MINTLFLTTVAVEPTIVTSSLALANIYPWPAVPFFQFSLKNSALKTNVHFFRHHFWK